ncbi:MAG: hypothetical protein COC24_013025 [Alphaproteobacteria bacterium]|nr:hypothetical protein [Alphaproteobacteria bacterium]
MRFKLETLDQLDTAAQPLAERVLKVSSDGIGGPFNMLLKSPQTGSLFVDMLDHFNGNFSHVPPLARRLTVLLLARNAHSSYAWWSHQRRALSAKEFTEGQINAINERRKPEGLGKMLDAVYDYVSALIQGTPTPGVTLTALRTVFDEATVVDLIVLCGTYTTVAMILNEADVKLPNNEINTLKND